MLKKSVGKKKKRTWEALYNHSEARATQSGSASSYDFDLKRLRHHNIQTREVVLNAPEPEPPALTETYDTGIYFDTTYQYDDSEVQELNQEIEGLVVRTTTKAPRYLNSVSLWMRLIPRIS